MKLLFLDQSGQLGGAELCLLEIVKPFRDRSLVCLFTDGPFREALQQAEIPVQILAAKPLQVTKDSGWLQGMGSLGQLLPLIVKVSQLSHHFDLIYANTQKAMVVGAVASLLSRRPLVYHLHDILTGAHFSRSNLLLAVTLANRFASQVIATSAAARTAFVAAGGRPEIVNVVYNGFDPEAYVCDREQVAHIRQEIDLPGKFLVGHFSRLSPWKGQHVLLEALQRCPDDIGAIFVGDALYGEQAYAETLQAQVQEFGLQERVRFLGFRSDVVPLMHCCDAIAHTSTAPEPFGRVIVEAMLCQRPVIAAQAGGVTELIEPEIAGWLVPPGDPEKLAAIINRYQQQREWTQSFAKQAQAQACQRFHRDIINQQIAQLLNSVLISTPSPSVVAQTPIPLSSLRASSPPETPPMNPTTTKPTISIFLPALAGGGAERAMLHLAQGLADRGFPTDLVLAKAEGDYLSHIPTSVRVVDLQASFPVVLSKTFALRHYLQQERPAVLFSALDILSSAIWAQRLAGVPTRIVMCVQTYLSRQFQNHQPHTMGKIRPRLVRWFYPWADAIVAASQGTAADVAQITGMPLEQIQVIYNPVVTPDMGQKMGASVDHPWFAPGEPPVILGVGRLVSQKDFPTLIDAFARLRRQRSARLMILGEGEDRPQLEAQIRALGLAQDVTLPGFVENPYAYMAGACVFVLSSIFEGFGNVVAEAIATGTSVVSTDCESGPAEILLNGKYGHLVPVGDAEAMAAAISMAIDRPIDPDILRQRAQLFSIDGIVDQYVDVLNQLLSQKAMQTS